MIFRIGQAVELSAVLEPHRNALLARQLHDLFDPRVLPPLRNGNAIDRPPSLQCLLNRVYARQLVHREKSLQSTVDGSRRFTPLCALCELRELCVKYFLSVATNLIQSRTKLQNPGASRFYRHSERKRGRLIQKQNHPVKF